MEVEKARTGMWVARWQGRLLASRIDPVAEGELWANHRREPIESKLPLVIVGLGSGYHVLAVLKRRLDCTTIVLEPRQELIDFFAREFPLEVGSVSVLRAESTETLLRRRDVRRLMEGRFHILMHEPSMMGMENEFHSIGDFLTGRSSLGWTQSVELRRDLRGRLKKTASFSPEPLTITQASEITDFDCPRTRQAFRAMSELVK